MVLADTVRYYDISIHVSKAIISAIIVLILSLPSIIYLAKRK